MKMKKVTRARGSVFFPSHARGGGLAWTTLGRRPVRIIEKIVTRLVTKGRFQAKIKLSAEREGFEPSIQLPV